MFNIDIASGFAHHLLSGTGFLRHKDQDIPIDGRDTPQPVTRLPIFGIDELILFFLPGADVSFFGNDTVFLETPLFNPYFAFTANFFFSAPVFLTPLSR
jgi:hypothetical protein